ncbi:MAG: ABC-2 transporter permease [Hominisplanchenecus sp.]
MWTICKKELRSYFTSMTGYVFIAFMLLLTGIYFTAYNMNMKYPMFGYTLSSVTFAFLIITPVLTMRSLAEEKKQKTDQLLFTSPVSIGQIVLGKYLALAGVFLVPVIVMGFYPLIMSRFGTVSMPMAYSALLGFFLLGCANIAVGLFLSSVTESQIIAAVLTFAVLFVCYMMEGIESLFSETAYVSYAFFAVLVLAVCLLFYRMMKSVIPALVTGVLGEGALLAAYLMKQSIFEGAIQKFLEVFNITGHFSNFVDGMMDLTGVVYYLSVIAVFLFLTVQSIQKRRWS